MFDQLKAMGVLAGLMRDKDRLRAASERVRAKLAALRVSASVGGGAVEAVATGEMRIESVRVSPALASGFADGDSRVMAEGLIAQAVNEALGRAKASAAQIIEAEAREMGLGDLIGQGALPGESGDIAGVVRGLLS